LIVVINDKLKDYLNFVSVCNSFNDISGHLPFILSYKKKKKKKKTFPNGFITPPPGTGRDKHETIFLS